MQLTNAFIFQYTEEFNENFNTDTSLRFPAKVNYVMQANFKKLFEIYTELAKARIQVYDTYCSSKENDNYTFEDENKIAQANQELFELMSMTQDVKLLKFDINALGDMMLTSKQMELLMYMIEGEE